MDILPNDILYEICLNLNYKDIIAFCDSKLTFNICNDRNFWLNKIQYDKLPIDFDYIQLNVDALQKLYKYYSMAIESVMNNKQKALEKGKATIRYKINNLNDIVNYLPEQLLKKLGIIDDINAGIILVFFPNNIFKLNIFYKKLIVIQITEEEIINLIANLTQYSDLQ